MIAGTPGPGRTLRCTGARAIILGVVVKQGRPEDVRRWCQEQALACMTLVNMGMVRRVWLPSIDLDYEYLPEEQP